MCQEGQLVDKNPCVPSPADIPTGMRSSRLRRLANAQGGRLLIGIEDAADTPTPDPRIDAKLADNGGEFIELGIPRAMSVASSTDAIIEKGAVRFEGDRRRI